MAQADPAPVARPRNIQPVVAKTFTTCMEQLQEGYVGSIAATAGCTMESKSRDHYGIDVEFTRPRGIDLEETGLAAQLKSTTTIYPNLDRGYFSYQFKKREYFQQLAKVRISQPKAVLIVMVTLPEQASWTSASHEYLSTRNCCYWLNLEGRPVPDVASPSVRVPTANIFDADALSSMLDRIERGETL